MQQLNNFEYHELLKRQKRIIKYRCACLGCFQKMPRVITELLDGYFLLDDQCTQCLHFAPEHKHLDIKTKIL